MTGRDGFRNSLLTGTLGGPGLTGNRSCAFLPAVGLLASGRMAGEPGSLDEGAIEARREMAHDWGVFARVRSDRLEGDRFRAEKEGLK